MSAIHRRQFIAALSTLAIFVCMVLGASRLLERKDSRQKYAPFFEEKHDFDVLFFGTSHVLNGVFPMELWEDYGFTSYNFGNHGARLGTTYWVMRNALDYTHPKVVVIDTQSMRAWGRLDDNFSYEHLAMDAFPLTRTKVEGIYDLFRDVAADTDMSDADSASGEHRSPMGLLWPFSVYHNRWNQLNEGDFDFSPTTEKGAESRIAVVKADPHIVAPSDKTLDYISDNEQALRDAIAYCQGKGIRVLLTYIPTPSLSEVPQQEINSAKKAAAEYGVDYIDFNRMNVVNVQTDYHDGSHLNPSGARKITDYLGKYLTEHYDVPDHRKDPDYSDWVDDYERYLNTEAEQLSQAEDLDVYLMLAADSHFGTELTLHDPALLQDAEVRELLKNLGADDAVLSENPQHLVFSSHKAEVLPNAGEPLKFPDGRQADLEIVVYDREDPDRIYDTAYFEFPETGAISLVDPETMTYRNTAERLHESDPGV